MNTKIFSIYDEASQAYMMPFFSPQIASAIRAVVTQLKNPESMIAQHPQDYTLYEVGRFDDALGQIFPELPNIKIAKITDYLEIAIGDPLNALREQPNLHGNPKGE